MSVSPETLRALQSGVFWVTKRIAIGQFASPERSRSLLEVRVTHILNVGEAESLPCVREGCFRQVIDVPLTDLSLIPDETAIRCMELIDQALLEPDAKLYIHCIAGQNRSPTILWLYLLACGMEPDAAKRLIADRCPNAVPGHESLTDDKLVMSIQLYGLLNIQPVRDPSTLEPAY